MDIPSYQRRFTMIFSSLLAVLVVAPTASLADALPPAPVIGATGVTQADPGVPHPSTTPCVVHLLVGQTFADYSSKPFAYAPPAACPKPWAAVLLSADFSVNTGRQFDRTAEIWIGSVNVYFGTTQEPSAAVSPSWHVERDITDYSALLATTQSGRADLGNTVDSTYTGIITGSADLLFYPAVANAPAPKLPDVVLPMSSSATGGTVSVGSASDKNSATFTLPTNIERAYLDVIAQSQAGDEFWYLCVPDQLATALQSCPGSGFRETEITLDGQPAGVAPVFPWIYTGGIDPYLWRPIPGVQTLNFKPYRVDLTPFAATLNDGQPHTLSLSVFNTQDHFATTATLLLYLDAGSTQVGGALTTNTLTAAPVQQINNQVVVTATNFNNAATAASGTVTVTGSHVSTIAGYVLTSHGRVDTTLTQNVAFSNAQQFTIDDTRYIQALTQHTNVTRTTDVKTGSNSISATALEDYPLSVTYAQITNADGSADVTTTINQSLGKARLIYLNNAFVYLSSLFNGVTPVDTLHFDNSGALTAKSGQASTQRYTYFDTLGAYYNRALTAVTGKVTATADSDPNALAAEANRLPWNLLGYRLPAFILDNLPSE